MWFWLGQWFRALMNISLDIFFLRLRDNAWHIWHKLVTWVIFPIMREDQSHNVMSEATGPASCDAPRPWLIFQPVNSYQPHHNRLLLHKGGTFSYFLIAKGVNNVIYWQSQYPINWRKSMWIWPDYSQARIRLGIKYFVFCWCKFIKWHSLVTAQRRKFSCHQFADVVTSLFAFGPLTCLIHPDKFNLHKQRLSWKLSRPRITHVLRPIRDQLSSHWQPIANTNIRLLSEIHSQTTFHG